MTEEHTDSVEVEGKRVRSLTDKGDSLYLTTLQGYTSKCEKSWTEVEDVLSRADDVEVKIKPLREYEKDLLQSQNTYLQFCVELHDFLQRTSTAESKAEFKRQLAKCNGNKKIMLKVLNQVKNLKQEVLETLSVGSATSNTSGSSSATRKRAKAEVERAKLKIIAKQAEVMKQKAQVKEEETKSKASAERKEAELNATLHVLKQEENAAAAEAEAQVFENFDFENDSISLPSKLDDQVERNLTETYVTEQAKYNEELYRTPSPRICAQPTPQDRNQKLHKPYIHRDFHGENLFPATSLNPDAVTFLPRNDTYRVPDAHPSQDTGVVTGLTQFLLRKDLIFSRFTNFNDKPEHFATWKASFKSIVKELGVGAFEEMDLLVKYLGPVSSDFARSIRASNVDNPAGGVRKIWDRLNDRFGQPEMIESALKKKLDAFPRLSDKDSHKLYELSDILSEIESSKENQKYSTLLSYFDSSTGVIPIVRKLPFSLQGKWTNRAAKYKKENMVSFPPFSFFVEFVKDMSKIVNDPSFKYDTGHNQSFRRNRETPPQPKITVRKSEIAEDKGDRDVVDPEKTCPLHNSVKHPLSKCKAFKSSSLQDRKCLLKQNAICFRCCKSTDHIARNCKETIVCRYCKSNKHASPMHVDVDSTPVKGVQPHGGEDTEETLSTKCTLLCGEEFTGRSCSKTLLVKVFPSGQPEKAVKVYAIIDEQSNRTLVRSELLDQLGERSEALPYTLTSCTGSTTVTGRRAKGYTIQSLDGSSTMDLPDMIECSEIPNDRSEIATPEVANLHTHLRCIADRIPELDPNAGIHLLIGRDLGEAHQIEQQILGVNKNAPFAQKLKLGWVVVGEVCLGKLHKPNYLNVKRTHVMSDGRGTVFDPCRSNIQLKELHMNDNFSSCGHLGDNVFQRSKDDNKIGLSIEDRKFLQLMDKEFTKDSNGHWIAPLPFRTPKPNMPNNRDQALKRAQSLHKSLQTDSNKQDHLVEFMDKILRNGVAEVAPPLVENTECWYLPLFGVYHPKKPGNIRGVFDSSAVYKGVSLNNELMSGPDLVNSLLGILLRFRKNAFAVTADIEQMFYQFFVKPEHRDYLRFFWYEKNDPNRPLIEYRMRVHVFGNKPSPAIATYGLRKTVENCEETYGSDVKDFVCRNFYVDDGLVSLSSAAEVTDLVKRSQHALRTEGSLRLHKIASNSSEVMEAFPPEDLGKELKSLDFEKDYLPLQRSLGLVWNLNLDSFVFDIPDFDKPFTRRGLLSTVNSLYDPIGFLAPFTIMGKILLRETTPSGIDWDEPLSQAHQDAWHQWQESLESLRELTVPRMYLDTSLSELKDIQLQIFCDASEKAIASAAYLSSGDMDADSHFAFVLGKGKLAPSGGHTIPRLELYGAVLAVELWDLISEHMDINPSSVKFYTDSKVVLGYIANDTRRFYTYVSNRVDRIRSRTSPQQWNYIPTHLNPADMATRYSVVDLDSRLKFWLHASLEVKQLCCKDVQGAINYPLVSPEEDKELRCQVLKTASISSPLTGLLERYSSWRTLVTSISLLRHLARSFQSDSTCDGWHYCSTFKTPDNYRAAECFILKEVQRQTYQSEIRCLEQNLPLPKGSSIIGLAPFLDEKGLMRLGGRLNKAAEMLNSSETNPIILPKGHVSKLLISHFHESVKHQGRHFTEGALRSNGYWIVGAKRAISSLIHECVTCRRLRGQRQQQQMADLPSDRLTPGPPFSSVGVDTFGPWEVVVRKTRGGAANSKRWAILFTCLVTRAIHIEVVEELSTSAFINALRRFISIRGPVNLIRSDRGTNFVGATDQLKMDVVNVEDTAVRSFLYKSGTTWIFNAPHSSHMGGVWERMIGVTRKILDSMLLTEKKGLSHDVLTTLMAEVCAIVNARPITTISHDPDDPVILSPAMLLTMKRGNSTIDSDNYCIKDMYRASWKHVQVLSDYFWTRWRDSYLQNLQTRRKWHEKLPNLKKGDIVLLRDKQSHRNYWPLGIVEDAIQSDDGLVRKAVVRVSVDGKIVTYTRPVCELVLLVD
ncbi:hypothetical protein FSP39_005230 [Pinctada imbricata]|uniref:Integrase catalytic domain-containing protein n=1 Tax=Pinctada imbricata TaxID=66713 RepID=A0AA88Y2G3_PINIB|nr:hypothetical protein FSP39_005230 [Pinctada imbricata]